MLPQTISARMGNCFRRAGPQRAGAQLLLKHLHVHVLHGVVLGQDVGPVHPPRLADVERGRPVAGALELVFAVAPCCIYRRMAFGTARLSPLQSVMRKLYACTRSPPLPMGGTFPSWSGFGEKSSP